MKPAETSAAETAAARRENHVGDGSGPGRAWEYRQERPYKERRRPNERARRGGEEQADGLVPQEEEELQQSNEKGLTRPSRQDNKE